MKYCVQIAFLGVCRQKDGTSEFVTLEPGTVFTVRGEVHGGFVKVMYQRRMLSVFVKDVETRALKITEASN